METWIPFTLACFVLSLVVISPSVQKKIFKFRQCNFAILFLSPLGTGRGSLSKDNWIPFIQVKRKIIQGKLILFETSYLSLQCCIIVSIIQSCFLVWNKFARRQNKCTSGWNFFFLVIFHQDVVAWLVNLNYAADYGIHGLPDPGDCIDSKEAG